MPQRCPFCRSSYEYSIALINHVRAKHPRQAELYFDEPTIDEPSTDDEELADAGYQLKPNSNDADILVDYDSDEELATKSDEESEPEANTLPPITQYFLQDAGRSMGDIPDTSGSLLEDPFFPFHTAYDFHLAKWFVDSKITKRKIEEYFKKGLYQGAGSYRSAYTLYKVIQDLPTTLGEPSWTFIEDQIDGETFVFCHRDPIVCIQYLLSQTAYSDQMVFAPVKEFNAAGERMYSELHTAEWWWNIQVRPYLTESYTCIICRY
jgi:hypothetical protein